MQITPIIRSELKESVNYIKLVFVEGTRRTTFRKQTYTQTTHCITCYPGIINTTAKRKAGTLKLGLVRVLLWPAVAIVMTGR